MIIDDKGRIFGKLSVIDLFALICICLIVMVAYFKIGTNSKAAVREREQPVRITFYKEALEDFTVSALEVGVPVLNDTNGIFMGDVTNVVIAESISHMPDSNGMIKSTPMEGFSSITITTEVMGRISEGAVLLDGNLYTKGSLVIIWAGKAKIQLHISDIAPIN